MPTKTSDKCRQCSKLSGETAMPSTAGVAIARHGKQGDGCWVGELRHKRRTYYKKRDLYTATAASSIERKNNPPRS